MNVAVLSLLIAGSFAQRSPYAGRRPIGFPVIETTTSQSDGLGNRFGEADGVTTQRLPIEALGDRELVNRLSKLPIDKQPFWLINWRALEENRRSPQTYPQKQNPFIDPINSLNNRNSQESQNQNAQRTPESQNQDQRPFNNQNAVNSQNQNVVSGQNQNNQRGQIVSTN